MYVHIDNVKMSERIKCSLIGVELSFDGKFFYLTSEGVTRKLKEVFV